MLVMLVGAWPRTRKHIVLSAALAGKQLYPCHAHHGNRGKDVVLAEPIHACHGFYCQAGSMQTLNIARHDQMYLAFMRCITQFFPSANISREHNFFCVADPSQSKKADIFLQFSDGSKFAIDFSKVNACSSSKISVKCLWHRL